MHTGPIRSLDWHAAKGDAAGDRLFEAPESPGNPGSDVWQIAIHDDGPSWNWFRNDSRGEILDVGHGTDPDDCKRQIEARRAIPVFRPSRIPPLAVAAAIAVCTGLVALAVWP
jgi:hypothetical protein